MIGGPPYEEDAEVGATNGLAGTFGGTGGRGATSEAGGADE